MINNRRDSLYIKIQKEVLKGKKKTASIQHGSHSGRDVCLLATSNLQQIIFQPSKLPLALSYALGILK